ncbi:MAG: hypothetical protein POELPBGB_00884 [Bacteroidia bacterium]|nr:hypothetical protein [Bacteroidia bacterium]
MQSTPHDKIKIQMRFILFSDSYKDDSEPAIVTQMFQNGLETFHLNKPRFTEEMYEEYIESIPEEYHSRIFIHQFHGYVTKYKLAGIYLHRRKGLNKDYLHRLQMWWYFKRRPDLKITCSFSKLSNMYEVKEVYDHVLLRPVFGSKSEGNYHSAFPETGLMDALGKTKHTVAAFGGTDYDKIETVFKLGFKGFAIKGGIWRSQDPFAEFIRIRDRVAELEKIYSQFE